MFYKYHKLLVMKSEFYLPMLKSKEGEFKALSKLNSFTKRYICPLFEVSPVEYDSESKKKPKKLEEHLHGFCHKKFFKMWHTENAFIDTGLLDGLLVNGKTCVEYIFDQIVPTTLIRVLPMPVAHINDSLQSQQGLIKVIKSYSVAEIGVRLKIEDVMDIRLTDKLTKLMSDLSLEYKNCHLIFDLANSDFSEYQDFSEGIISLLETFPHLSDWKSFTLCGGAFPRSDLLKKGKNNVIRLDWKLYHFVVNGISQTKYARKINYGDYSIVTPGYFEFDPKKMKRSANIRYTLGEKWLIIKGSALSKPGDNKQYITQAGEICGSQEYLGEAFSDGDQHIKSCHLGRVSPGNPTVWNWVGNNHHFTKVVLDLFASPAGS